MPNPFQLMKMKPVARGEPYEPFSRVSVETISWCNRKCSFCPVAWTDRGRRPMSDRLFASVCRQLGAMRFGGVVQMFLLSEPLIDPRFHERLADMRAACPKATLYASTNGDVLDAAAKGPGGMDAALRKMRRLYDAGLTVLGINVYDEGDAQASRYQAMMEAALGAGVARTSDRSKYARHPIKGRWLYLTDMRQSSQGQGSRQVEAGDLGFSVTTDKIYDKVKEGAAEREAPPQLHCHRAQRHIVVEWDGRVPLCCAIDVTDPSVPAIGDATTTPLLEIWNSDAFRKYRWHTQRGERVLPGCSTCHHRMGGFPHAVRRVADPSDRERAAWEREVSAEAKRLGRSG